MFLVIISTNVLCSRLEAFVEWMDGVETTINDLKKETLSTQEYKQTLARFQVINLLFLILILISSINLCYLYFIKP